MPAAARTLALTMVLACLSCRSRPDGSGNRPTTFDDAVSRLTQRLPRADVPAQAATRPALLGEVLFDHQPAGVADAFAYTAVRDAAGRTFLLRRGGFVGATEWYGPAAPDDAVSTQLLADLKRLVRRE